MTKRLITRSAIAFGGAALFFIAAIATDREADASAAGPAVAMQETVRQDARCWSNRLVEACVLRPVAR